MSFRFADVEFGVQDEHGHEVTSAVLIQTHYNAAEASTAPPSRRGQGKNQGKCLDLPEVMLADRRAKIEKSGRDPGLAHISVVEWREAAKATGLQRGRVHEVTRALSDGGAVVLCGDFVRPAGGAAWLSTTPKHQVPERKNAGWGKRGS